MKSVQTVALAPARTTASAVSKPARKAAGPASAILELQRSAGNRVVRQLLEGSAPPAVDRVLRSEGAPLHPDLRLEMEERFGEDFSGVRLHTGVPAAAAADAMGARAFAIGSQLVFGRGEYDAVTTPGRMLLAHELAHVIQQRRGGAVPTEAGRTGLERASDRAAEAVVRGGGPVCVEGSSGRTIAREEKDTLGKSLDVKMNPVGERAYTYMIDGVVAFKVDVPENLQNSKFGFRVEEVQDHKLILQVEGDLGVNVLQQQNGIRELAAKGYEIRIFDVRRPSLEDRGGFSELPPLRILQPPSAKPKPKPQPQRKVQPKPPPKDERDRPPPPSSAQKAPVTDKSSQDRPQPTPVIAAPETSAPPLDPQVAAVLAQLRAEMGEVDPLVVKLAADAPLNPAGHALNELRGLADRLKTDEQFLRAFEPRSGASAKDVHAALARIGALQQLLAPAVAGAVKWHDDNSPGKSLGMLNEEGGTWLAGQGLEQYDKGGIHYVSGTAAFAGAFVVAFVDAGEKVFSFGVHDTATAVSQAYTKGDISWNDGDKLMGSAIDRAVLIALVTKGAGAGISRLGVMSAEALAIAPTATRFGVVAGGVSGGLSSITALGTQSLLTWSMEGEFTTPQSKAIWNQGMPQGKEWAIAIPLGVLLGSAGGVRAVQLSNEKLIGTTVNTPAGPMKIVSISKGGQAVATPLGSGLEVPPAPPASDVLLTYDTAAGGWKAPQVSAANVPAVPAVADVPPAGGTPLAGSAGGVKDPGGGGVPGGGGGGGLINGPGRPAGGPVTLYLPGKGVNPNVSTLTGESLEAALQGRLQLLDELGRPINIRRTPAGQVIVDMDTTLLGETRLVDAAGKPLSGQVPSPWKPLLDASGRPAPFAPRTGPVVLDLQAGTPAYGDALVQRVPGAQVLGAEGGNWLLGYQRINPTSAGDLNLSLQIGRNSPVWPNTPAFRTSIEGMPRALPWELDPAAQLFPKQGPITMLGDPLNPNLGAQFFPAAGRSGRLIPQNLGDVTGVRSAPQLPLAGQVDQILLRRPFGLGTADPATSELMGQRLGQMLKPGGFVEMRPTRATDIGPVQIDAVKNAIPGSYTVRVSGADVAAFKATGSFPEGATAIEKEMISSAASDISGLGAGDFKYSIRIYAPPAP